MRLDVPPKFLSIPYDFDRHPQSAEFDFGRGANCQLYAYALLKHFGLEVPPFRSSELWQAETHTHRASEFQPLDLLLFNETEDACGAHVAVYVGEGTVVHLSKKVGLPAFATIQEMLSQPKYQVLIGAKRAAAGR